MALIVEPQKAKEASKHDESGTLSIVCVMQGQRRDNCECDARSRPQQALLNRVLGQENTSEANTNAAEPDHPMGFDVFAEPVLGGRC